jgi:hypothetical protein
MSMLAKRHSWPANKPSLLFIQGISDYLAEKGSKIFNFISLNLCQSEGHLRLRTS